jgi:hypothetical protein
MSDKPTNFICWVCILLNGSGIAGFLAFTKGHSDAESSKAPLRRVRRTRRKDSPPSSPVYPIADEPAFPKASSSTSALYSAQKRR